MELLLCVCFLSAALTTVHLVVTILWRRRRGATRKYKLPPGPQPWPVTGNLHLIGSLPHHSIHALSARYGPFMSLRFGSVPVIVGSSVDAARFFLRTSDAAFIDRPKMAAGEHAFYDYADMAWSPYGAYWRQARKLWKTKIFSARQLASHERVRGEEVRALLRDLHLHGPSSAVVLREHLLMLTLNTISRMALGRKYDVDDVEDAGSPATSPGEFRWMVDELFAINAALCIGDFIPWLSWLDLQGYIRRMKKLGEKLDRFLEHVVDEHNERRRREGDKFLATDMVDVLLEHADDPNNDLEVPIQRDGVKGFALDLISGGSHTVALTIEWAMSELLRNPEVLAKATDELDDVIGHGRLVTEQDIGSLPYLGAIVKETFRLHPVAPMLSPRLCREDASTAGGGGGGGYDVPMGTLVFVNVWTIGRDAALWGDRAAEFWPERFVGNGVDVRGQDMELLPFGSGRRMCPGYTHGLRMVQLTLANLLHAFAWRLPDGVATDEINMQEKMGIALQLMVPLQAVAETKLPAHLF